MIKLKIKRKRYFLLVIFLLFFSFNFAFAKGEIMPVGTLLYKTGPNGKTYGKNTDILFKMKGFLGFDLNSGHVGIYVGRVNKVDMVVEAVNKGITMDPLKYFVNLRNGEKFLGAKIPKNSTKSQREAAAAIARALAKLDLKYDFSFHHQKGPKSNQWICVGLAEKVYESADPIISNNPNIDFSDNPNKVFNFLIYNPSRYRINITPDGYDDTSIFNRKTGDVFSLNKEFSMIAPRGGLFLERKGVYDFGLIHNRKRYFFLPYTQYEQKTLKSVPLPQDKINKLEGYFSKEVEEKYKGKLSLVKLAVIGIKDNASSNIKDIAYQGKKSASFVLNKTKQGLEFVSQKTDSFTKKAVNAFQGELNNLFHFGPAQISHSIKPAKNLVKTNNKSPGEKNNKTSHKTNSKNKTILAKKNNSQATDQNSQKEKSLEAMKLNIERLSQKIDLLNKGILKEKQSQKGTVFLKNKEKEKKEAEKASKNKAENKTENKENKEDKENYSKSAAPKGNKICQEKSIELNKASLSALEKLTNIGPVTAKKIIQARPFFSLDDLIKVKGIGEKTLEEIKEQGCAFTDLHPNHVASFHSNGGSASANAKNKPSYAKIIISEVQITPTNQRFIELYNPNKEDIDLTGWYIQRKTKNSKNWGSLISSTKLKSKKILAKNYFLITRTKSDYENKASLRVDYSLASDNAIALKNPNKKIVDKIGWGYASDYESAPAANPAISQSLARKWDNSNSNYLNRDDNSYDFEKTDYPTPDSKNIQPAPDLSLSPDTISFQIVESDTASQSQVINISNTGGGKLFWQSTISYDSQGSAIGWLGINSISGSILAHDSIDVSVYTTDTASNLPVGNYQASIVFTDSDNDSDAEKLAVDLTVKEKPITPSGEVVINEIDWMGTRASSSDEWLEFYNTTGSDIDISRWSIYGAGNASKGNCLNFSDADGKTSFKVPSKGYLIYANGKDDVQDSFGKSLVDIWDATISLKNSSPGRIILYDTPDCQSDSNVVDIVNQKEGNWFAGKNEMSGNKIVRATMERIKSGNSGTDSSNWATNDIVIRNGQSAKDKNGEQYPINGTPKAENSASQTGPTEIKSLPFDNDIRELSLSASKGPYVIRNKLTVPKGDTLGIEPGTVLKFIDSYGQYAGLEIDGTLKAVGTSDKKIVFTSLKDDDYGGDTNNDKGKTKPNPGDWDKIYFSPTSTGSKMENVIVRYAGGGYGTPCSPKMAGLEIEQTSLDLENSTIEQSQYRGLWLINSLAKINNVKFLDNPVCSASIHYQYGGYGLEVEGGKPDIENSVFKGSLYGIYIKDKTGDKNNQSMAKPTIKNNKFQENKKSAIWLSSGLPEFCNNEADSNSLNGIFLFQGGSSSYILTDNTSWPRSSLTYIVYGIFKVPEKTVLAMSPGTIFKFFDSNSKFEIDGTLEAVGTSDKKIVFTSLKDDDYGGDTNNDKGKTKPNPGDWDKIYFSPTSTGSKMENVIVRYAGGGVRYPSAGIEIDKSSLDLENSEIRDNLSTGLHFSSTILKTDSSSNYPLTKIENVSFSGNKRKIGSSEEGYNVYLDGANISLKNSLIEDSVFGICINKGNPELDNLIFGTEDKKNSRCNLYDNSQHKCLDPSPSSP